MDTEFEYRPVRFFVAVAVVTWIPWTIAAYIGSQKGMEASASILNLLGLAGPLAVSLVLIRTSGSSALRHDFKDRIVNLRRLRPSYLILAMALPPAVMGLSIWLSLGLGQSSDQFRLSGGSNLAAMFVLALILAPIIEETGWRGYGVDSLTAKIGVLRGALLFGGLWSLWHAPLVLIPGTYHYDLARMDNPLFLINFFVSIIPAAIIANWFYYRNDRSIIMGIVFHSMLNAAGVLPNAGQVAKCIATLLYAGIAVAILLRDRTVFRGGPRSFVSGRPGGIPDPRSGGNAPSR